MVRLEVQGNHFLQDETLLYYVQTKPGDAFNERRLREDFRRLWDTGFLEDLQLEANDGPSGKVVIFRVAERKRIQIVDYRGSKELTATSIEDELKKREAQVRIDTFYDVAKARRVESIIGGDAGPEGPSVRHRQARDEEHRRSRPAAVLRHRGRPEGEDREDHLRRQHGLLGRPAAREAQEPEGAGPPDLARREDDLHRAEVAGRGREGPARRPGKARGLLPRPRVRHGPGRAASHHVRRRQAEREEADEVHDHRHPRHRGRAVPDGRAPVRGADRPEGALRPAVLQAANGRRLRRLEVQEGLREAARRLRFGRVLPVDGGNRSGSPTRSARSSTSP